MNVQKINVKIFTDTPGNVGLDPFLTIFARWRENASHAAGWIDLADYAHVDRGPGVMLIGRQGNLSVDLADPGPGLLYANKKGLSGPPEARIGESFLRSLSLVKALIEEPEYPVGLVPRTGFWELAFNDRLEAPNVEATDRELEPAVRAVAGALFGEDSYTLIRQTDPERCYGFTLHSDVPPDLDSLADRIQRAIGEGLLRS